MQLQRDGFLASLRDRRTDLWNTDPAHQAVAANRLGWVDPLALIEAEHYERVRPVGAPRPAVPSPTRDDPTDTED